jgi:hypothetical protein
MATSTGTSAEKVAMYREKAKDTSLPQDVRNAYLDKATALEAKAYEETKAGETKSNTPPKYSKGGAVNLRAVKPVLKMKMMSAYAKGGAVKKAVKSPVKKAKK